MSFVERFAILCPYLGESTITYQLQYVQKNRNTQVHGREMLGSQEHITGAHHRSTSQEHITGAHHRSTSQEHIIGAHHRSTSQEHITVYSEGRTAHIQTQLVTLQLRLWLLLNTPCMQHIVKGSDGK